MPRQKTKDRRTFYLLPSTIELLEREQIRSPGQNMSTLVEAAKLARYAGASSRNLPHEIYLESAHQATLGALIMMASLTLKEDARTIFVDYISKSMSGEEISLQDVFYRLGFSDQVEAPEPFLPGVSSQSSTKELETIDGE